MTQKIISPSSVPAYRLHHLPPPGKAPYGYRKTKERYQLDRSTAPVVKDFFERFLRLGSLRGAVRFLEKRYGKKISVSTARRWLSHPVYRGDLLYGDKTIISDTHSALISREDAAQVDRLLRSHGQHASKTASAPRSLAGLVVCQACQSPLIINRVTQPRSQHDYLYLRPQLCPRQSKCSGLDYHQVLRQIIEQVCEQFPQKVAEAKLPSLTAIKTAITAQIEQKQAIILKLSELETEGILDQASRELRDYHLQGEIAQLRQQIEELPPDDLKRISDAVTLPQFWLDLSEEERRFYFREFIQQIQVQRHGQAWQIEIHFVF